MPMPLRAWRHPTNTCARRGQCSYLYGPWGLGGWDVVHLGDGSRGTTPRRISGTGALSVGVGWNVSRERGHGNIGAKTRWVSLVLGRRASSYRIRRIPQAHALEGAVFKRSFGAGGMLVSLTTKELEWSNLLLIFSCLHRGVVYLIFQLARIGKSDWLGWASEHHGKIEGAVGAKRKGAP